MSRACYTLAVMFGTYFNMATVLVGGLLGLFLRKRLHHEIHSMIYTCIGIISIVLGLSMVLESSNLVYIVLSLVIGGLIGHWLKLEDRILALGDTLWKVNIRLFPSTAKHEQNQQFAHSFLNASVLFCSGSLAILGSIMAGVSKNYDLLIMKSVLDGIIAIIFTAASGIGVIFSIFSILVYQGGITILASFFGSGIDEYILQELGATGGVLIIFIGARLWDIRKIRISNFLPSLLVIMLLGWLHLTFGHHLSGIL